MSKDEKRVLRIIEECQIDLPLWAEKTYRNIIAAAEILSDQEIVQMFADYGCAIWGELKPAPKSRKKAKFIIKDWANNVLFDGKLFPDFEAGWDFLYALHPEDDACFDDYFVEEV